MYVKLHIQGAMTDRQLRLINSFDHLSALEKKKKVLS